jgi:hypothetical protein
MDPLSRVLRWRQGAMLALLVACFTVPGFGQTPTLEVSASRDSVYLGESFLLEVKVGGSDPSGTPDLSAIRNCAVALLGSHPVSHQSIIVVNGRMRREGFTGRIYSYRMTPSVAGPLPTGPVRVNVGTVALAASGPTVSVTGITAQDVVSLSVTPNRDTVLVDEPFDIRLAIRIRRLAGAYANADPLFPGDPPHLEAPFLNPAEIEGLKGSDPRQLLNGRLARRDQPGFTLNDYTTQENLFDFSSMFEGRGTPARFMFERSPVTGDGQECWEYAVTTTYTPLQEGTFTFGPVLFKGRVATSVNAQGSASDAQIFAVGPAATVRVVPPPEENRPDAYIGAIGSNLTISAELDAQVCNVGDPLTLTLSIGGAIQMRNLAPPRLGLQSNLVARFEVYDDTVKTVRQDGQCRYAYTLRPRQAGSFELPPVEAAYYDVTERRYRVVQSSPIPIKVRQTSEVTASQIIGGSTNVTETRDEARQAAMNPAGIRAPADGAEPRPLINRTRALMLLGASGPCLFGCATALAAYRRHRPRLLAIRRRRHACRLANRGLKRGTPLAPAAVCQAMRNYLSQRFDIRAGAFTPDDAARLLRERSVPPDVAERFVAVMRRSFDASFAAQDAAATTRPEAAAEAIQALDLSLPSPGRWAGPSALPALFLLLTLVAAPGQAASQAERDFIWTEAGLRMAAANTPADFLAAARTYQKLVDAGGRNEDVFYNQGTALLLAGKPADALDCFRRAERLGGGASDLRRNMAIAQAREEGANAPVTPWSRVLFFWHYGLSCSTRAWIAVACFTLCWIGAALRWSPWRRLARVAVALGLVGALVFGTGVLVTLQQESAARLPAALRSEDRLSFRVGPGFAADIGQYLVGNRLAPPSQVVGP